MERFTISLDDNPAREFDELIAARGYGNHSEAVRDIFRSHLEKLRQTSNDSRHCVASLSYLYNHHERELAERLAGLQHDHHDLTVTSMHAHHDHEHCIDMTILRDPTANVRRLPDALVSVRGVRHGNLNLVSVEVDNGHPTDAADHDHGDVSHHYRPAHLKPRS